MQKLYQFKNGYGASVIKNQFSYGGDKGLWELAVIHFPKYEDITKFDLIYDTPITNDVIGHQSEDKIDKLLNRIESLPVRNKE